MNVPFKPSSGRPYPMNQRPLQRPAQTRATPSENRTCFHGVTPENIPSTSRAMLSSPEFLPMDWQPNYGTVPVQPLSYGGVPIQPSTYSTVQQPAYGIIPIQPPTYGTVSAQPPRYKPIFMRNGAGWFAEDPLLQAEFAKTAPSLPVQSVQQPAAREVPNKKPKQLTPKKDTDTKVPPVPKCEALRVLSGGVDKILKWARLSEGSQLLFEVVGPLLSVRQGATAFEKVLLLREEVGPALQVLFYEIDRPLGVLRAGQHVRCVGQMLSRNRMQAFCVSLVPEEQHASMQRLAFVCQRVFQELSAK